ncbi:MAG: hypothetical protein J0H15_08580 [Xanthomonadales bacterium]|nr:hypothetical protein [Xanthomonadales bacterium]
MNTPASVLKSLFMVVLVGICCSSAFALTIIVPPLEPEKLPGTWISPVGEFAQVRFVFATSGNGTFVLAPYRSLERDDLRAYLVSNVRLDQYSLSLTLQPLSGGSSIEVSGQAQRGELTLLLPEDAGLSDDISVRLVPEEVARKEINDIEHLQAVLAELSKRAEF